MRLYVYKDREVQGPFALPEIEAMLRDERIQLSDLATLEAFEYWKPLGEFAEVASANSGHVVPPIKQMMRKLDELDLMAEQLLGGEATPRGVPQVTVEALMDQVNRLQEGEFIRSDSQRAHFRDIVAAFNAARATRRGSREILSPEGTRFIVDVYVLQDGREVMAGYMDPEEKARLDGLLSGVPGETTEAAVKRLVARVLEVEGGIARVELADRLGGVKLQMNPLTSVELAMACEQEFGLKLGEGEALAMGRPDFRVGDLVKLIEQARE